ncbi:hypothetical protein PENSPDRAFT_658066 [Peniophora sp. CONT]|nr:hypothetical protein PENSPDRAFT_658066 [Peniophora sp. CONT]
MPACIPNSVAIPGNATRTTIKQRSYVRKRVRTHHGWNGVGCNRGSAQSLTPGNASPTHQTYVELGVTAAVNGRFAACQQGRR